MTLDTFHSHSVVYACDISVKCIFICGFLIFHHIKHWIRLKGWVIIYIFIPLVHWLFKKINDWKHSLTFPSIDFDDFELFNFRFIFIIHKFDIFAKVHLNFRIIESDYIGLKTTSNIYVKITFDINFKIHSPYTFFIMVNIS